MAQLVQLGRKDLATDQEVKWCPGCGDYGILKAVQTSMAGLGVPREKMVVVSGIGCAARFPYYVNTYGIHGIHGRAAAVATGVKMANPELSVFAIGGDGDMMSIGGNHLIHALRRNIDITILLFNNRIYGLTKGQFSPTTGPGARTKSSPMGSIDNAFDPCALALGAGGTFVARTVDLWGKHLTEIVTRAHNHKGTAFVEILQNCKIFNDGAFEPAVGRANAKDNTVDLVHGQPAVFGANRDKGLRIGKDGCLEVVTLGDGITEADLVVHDAAKSNGLAEMMATMEFPEFPVPTGILRHVHTPRYEDMMEAQVADAVRDAGGGRPDLRTLLHGGDTWSVA
jgi:2-oxoglutarate/2-oxoacid ferredoxin oxidoreductase subunit beta